MNGEIREENVPYGGDIMPQAVPQGAVQGKQPVMEGTPAVPNEKGVSQPTGVAETPTTQPPAPGGKIKVTREQYQALDAFHKAGNDKEFWRLYSTLGKGEGAKTEIEKLFDFKDKLIKSGLKPDDPKVKAVDAKINVSKTTEQIVAGSLKEKLKREPTDTEIDEALKARDIEKIKAGVIAKEKEGITPDAAEQQGALGLLTGTYPFTGIGGVGRKEMINASAKIAKERGWTPNDVLRIRADYKAMDKSVTSQRKVYDLMHGFVINMDKQMDRVDAIYKQLPRAQYRLLNIPIVKLRTIAEGSGEEASAAAILIELGNESGKLSTNSAASIRELSESAQKQWAKIHDNQLSYNELKKVLAITRGLGHDRLNSTKEAMDFTLQGIKSLGKTAPPSKENGETKKPKTASEYLKSIGQ